MVCCIKTSFIFLLDKRPQLTLFRVDCRKDLFHLPFEKRARILVTRAMRMSVCFSFRFFKHHQVALGAALRAIVRYDAPVNNAVLQINVFCTYRHPTIRDKNNTKSEIQYSLIGRIMLAGF